MHVVKTTKYDENRKLTVDEAVAEKMKVLEELCVVTNSNKNKIRKQLENAIAANPDKDYEHILDRVAHTLIAKRYEHIY